MKALYFTAAYLLPIATFAGAAVGGWATFSTAFLGFVLLPILDPFFGADRSNPTPQQIEGQDGDWAFRLILYLYVPAHFALNLFCVRVASQPGTPWYAFAALVLSLGISNAAIGMNAAHELFHKTNAWERFLGKALLLMVSYMPLYIEHIQIHHRYYATAKDTATSYQGDSYYRYLPRALKGKYVDSWQVEFERLRKHGQLPFGPHNQMLWFIALPLLLAGALGWLWGWRAPAFFFLQSFAAISVFETFTYIQHYGLMRKSGEADTPIHSWDTYNRVDNFMFFQAPRHADHHDHMPRRFQVLEAFPERPLLPCGYPKLVLLAFAPFLWRRTMDPAVDHARAGGRG